MINRLIVKAAVKVDPAAAEVDVKKIRGYFLRK